MTESTTTPESTPAKRSAGGGLGGKVLAELQEIAAGLGIENIQGMRKGALIDAIKAARGDTKPAEKKVTEKKAAEKAPSDEKSVDDKSADDKPAGEKSADDKPAGEKSADDKPAVENVAGDKADDDKSEQQQGAKQKQQNQPKQNQQKQQGGNQQKQQNQQNQPKQNEQAGPADDDDDDNNRRGRNRRGRNRNRGMEAEPTYSEDDVLVPAAGILDILDNYAFVRTTGYLPSEQDVYVSLSMVRKWGLRRGDAVTGQVRQPREGERKEKFNPMVKVESVNGLSLDDAAKRVEFDQTVALHPAERLRLDNPAGGVTARTIDLVAPIGKGQRGLIVAPTGAGKTQALHHLAAAITEGNPECHLMVVLVDQRPEEITDFQRSVKGEVIASAFDRPAGDHPTVAELAIERAKRLVELGHDVVVLLDGANRLGRAYLQAAAGSNRGVTDAAALFPAKAFLGAARNIEDGGSLTILATAASWAGEADDVVIEELTVASNWVLHLDDQTAAKQIYPAVDVLRSGTRNVERVVDTQEVQIVNALRRSVDADAEPHVATEQLVARVGASATNAEVLLQLNQSLQG